MVGLRLSIVRLCWTDGRSDVGLAARDAVSSLEPRRRLRLDDLGPVGWVAVRGHGVAVRAMCLNTDLDRSRRRLPPAQKISRREDAAARRRVGGAALPEDAGDAPIPTYVNWSRHFRSWAIRDGSACA